MENIINNLEIEKYDQLTNEEKEKLKIYEEKSKPLQVLINNYKELKYNQLKKTKIIGPTLVCKLTRKDKTIYIFGESHIPYKHDEENKEYMTVKNFFHHVFRYSPVPLDFFLEIPEYFTVIDKPDYDLYNLRNMIIPCLKTKYSCPYFTTRFHYTDIRMSYKKECLFTLFTIHIVNNMDMFTIMNKIDLFNQDMMRIIILTFRRIILDLKNECDSLYKLKKQFHKIEDETIKKYVEYVIRMNDDFYTDSLNTYTKKYPNFYELLSRPYHNVIHIDLNTPKDYVAGILEYILFRDFDIQKKELKSFLIKFLFFVYQFLDAYALARMFRKYRRVENKISIEPRNIIFYGGSSHSKNMISVLQKSGFELTVYKSVKTITDTPDMFNLFV